MQIRFATARGALRAVHAVAGGDTTADPAVGRALDRLADDALVRAIARQCDADVPGVAPHAALVAAARRVAGRIACPRDAFLVAVAIWVAGKVATTLRVALLGVAGGNAFADVAITARAARGVAWHPAEIVDAELVLADRLASAQIPVASATGVARWVAVLEANVALVPLAALGSRAERDAPATRTGTARAARRLVRLRLALAVLAATARTALLLAFGISRPRPIKPAKLAAKPSAARRVWIDLTMWSNRCPSVSNS